MTQDLDYSNILTTPKEVFDEWFDDTHPPELDEDDLPDFDIMKDEDTE